MDTNKIKKGLGRGLSSLIGETKTEVNINKLSISNLVSNKFQPRKIFDEENLQDLTNSIKKRGIIQPIIVRKSSDDSSKYEIVALTSFLKPCPRNRSFMFKRSLRVTVLLVSWKIWFFTAFGSDPSLIIWSWT